MTRWARNSRTGQDDECRLMARPCLREDFRPFARVEVTKVNSPPWFYDDFGDRFGRGPYARILYLCFTVEILLAIPHNTSHGVNRKRLGGSKN